MRAGNVVRWFFVTAGVIALTSVTVDATLNGGGVSQSALGILATSLGEEESQACPEGMTAITTSEGERCIDQYEASTSADCPTPHPQNVKESQDNVTASRCMAVSEPDALPWTQLTREQASLACAKAGKRLPTNEEWYRAALGTPDFNDNTIVCNVNGSAVSRTGSNAECRSSASAYDMIGNVWEWVEGDVYDGVYEGRALPKSGYVAQVDSDGVAIYTEENPNELLFADYAWTSASGAYGIIRGGYHGNETDGGVYALNAYTLPTTPGAAIGFRCVK